MLKKAKSRMDELGAHFLFTGEVLGQRPMSQHLAALQTIEREAALAAAERFVRETTVVVAGGQG